MYKRILVATDGSSLSKKAVNSAISMAALCGAELVALKVVPRYPQSYFEGGLALPVSEISRVEKQWAADGQTIVYMPRSGYCEDHSFTYTIRDKNGNEETTTVYININ